MTGLKLLVVIDYDNWRHRNFNEDDIKATMTVSNVKRGGW